MTDEEYINECKSLIKSIGSNEIKRLFTYEEAEVDCEFLGFLDNYKDIPSIVPLDFTIIDVGCYMAFQADYFKHYKSYIGIEPFVPVEFRLKQTNAKYFLQTMQDFIKNPCGFNIDKSFVICSAVPDFSVKKIIVENFPYFRIAYPGKDTVERLPIKYNKMEGD